jgi:SMI1 / KNR4 family (SUKH-1)
MKLSYQSRIAGFATRAGSDKVFGAGHRFELTRHSPAQILLFEEQLGVRLPEEYVQVLTETGSGAGPYYGLFPPGKVLQEIENLMHDSAEGIELARPSAPFPFRQADADAICARLKIDRQAPGKAAWLSNGCIPLCTQGCTFHNALVTAGELRGRVWSVNDDGSPAEWAPAQRPPGLLPEGSVISGKYVVEFMPRPLPAPPTPPTFLQWYESWLERVEIDLDDYSRYKSEDRHR